MPRYSIGQPVTQVEAPRLLTGVELWIAATHQAGAIVVFTLALWTAHGCRAGPVDKPVDNKLS